MQEGFHTVQHDVTINALRSGSIHGGALSPRSPGYATRSNINQDSRDTVVRGVSSHPLHEDGIRPRAGSTRESANTHTAVASSSLYVPSREPVLVEQNAKYHITSTTVISSIGSSLGLARSDDKKVDPPLELEPSQENRSILSLDSSNHALLASTLEQEEGVGVGGGGGVMGMGMDVMTHVDRVVPVVVLDYNYDINNSADGGAADDNDYSEEGEEGDIEQAIRGRPIGARQGQGTRVRDRKEIASHYSALSSSSALPAAAAADMNMASATVKYAAWACMLLAILSGAAIGPGTCRLIV